MFGLGFTELLVILVIALIFFGPGKLPEVGRALGASLREFRGAARALSEAGAEAESEIIPDEEPPRPRDPAS